MKIYLIRHGESTSDIENRYGGTYDDELTNRGKTQAEELAKKLKSKNIEYINYSPYKRARETAAILIKELGVISKEVKNIRERNSYGILSGLTRAEAKEKYPKEYREIENRDYNTTITGATNYSTFKSRIISAFRGIISNEKHSTLAIVTHGGPIYCIFRELIIDGEIKNVGDCACLELEYSGGKIDIINLGKAYFEQK